MTTYLYGAYGTGNLGDDALLKSALEEYGETDSVVVSYGKPFLEKPVTWVEHFQFIKQPECFMNRGDRLIFAGGGLFWAASHTEDMANTAEVAKKLGCEVRIDRIGAQGVHSNISAAKRLFDLCDYVSVRDKESVEILISLGITDKAIAKNDFVFTLKDFPRTPYFTDGKIRIGINHSATPFYSDESHRTRTLTIYNKIVNNFPDIEFCYIPHTRHFNVMCQNDIINGEYFWKVTQGRIVSLPFPASVEQLLMYYASMSAVIGWRYHLLVIGQLYNLPCAFLGQLGGHKYGAFSKEKKLPQINFDAPVNEIVSSASRFIRGAINVQ